MRHLLATVMMIMLIGLQFRLWTGEGSFAHIYRLEEKVAQQQLENKKLYERNAALAAKVIDFKQGMDGIEERARNELGMIREGETFYLVVN